MNVPEWNSAQEAFFVKGLGFAPDPRADDILKMVQTGGKSMNGLVWANAGLQQLHMPLGEPAPHDSQSPPGVVGVVYADVAATRSTLKRLSIDTPLVPTQEGVNGVKDVGPAAFQVTSPTGVRFFIHGIRSKCWLTPQGWMNTEEAQKQGVGLPSAHPSECLGIPYIRLSCPAGTASGLARFYCKVFDSKAEVRKFAKGEECWVPIGAAQWLIYREVPAGEPVPYDGYHIAIYINGFVEAYREAQSLGVLWNNPRFPMTYDYEADAVRYNEFRVLRLVDPSTGDFLCEMEHEIRALSHPGFCAKAWLETREC